MVEFIDRYRTGRGVESICGNLQIAPSTYYERKAQQAKPERRSDRKKREETLRTEIRRVWEANFAVYGARKVWRQLKRTTIAAAGNREPLDLVRRDFHADRPNRLGVADFTYVATWSGFVFVAFIIDAFSRMIVGWRAARTMKAELTLDALEQALWSRRIKVKLIHHSDHGSRYLSIRYSERLAEAGIEASVGSVGSAYDNALAETINGLFKTEVIRRRGPWKNLEAVEYATLEWVH